MVSNINVFMLTRSELEGKLRWYENRYGPVINKRGLQNWKNLFRKPNIYEWVILIMLFMALFMGWAYQRDFEVYKQNIQIYSCQICYMQTNQTLSGLSWPNESLIINEENSEEEEVT